MRAPAIALTIEAAEAIAQGCSQYPLGGAIVDAAGKPILVHVADGSDPGHGYTAIRKDYTAVRMKTDTIALVGRTRKEPAFAVIIS